jgi:hypothetical protein
MYLLTEDRFKRTLFLKDSGIYREIAQVPSFEIPIPNHAMWTFYEFNKYLCSCLNFGRICREHKTFTLDTFGDGPWLGRGTTRDFLVRVEDQVIELTFNQMGFYLYHEGKIVNSPVVDVQIKNMRPYDIPVLEAELPFVRQAINIQLPMWKDSFYPPVFMVMTGS